FSIDNNGENTSTATTCESAEASYEHVISFAGNGIAPDKRTAIDQQCANETRTGTGSCSGTAAYDSAVTDLNKYSIKCGVSYSYPGPVLQKTITDKDNDGMDDAWEEARGLNPGDPTDYKGDYLGDGYMNIEYYINDLTVDAFPAGTVQVSPETGPVAGRSAFERIEAEDFSDMEGIQTEDTSDDNGVQNIGYIENNDYVMYKRMDFEDGAKSFTARISGNPCVMELYADSMKTPLARVRFGGSGGFGNWTDLTVGIPELKGIHNLYIKFIGGEGYLENLNWFVFGREEVPSGVHLVKDLKVLDTANSGGWDVAERAQTGLTMYGDRSFVYTMLPEELDGSEAVLTACDSKNASTDTATFTAGDDVTVYIGLDSRVENVPAWLGEYTKTTLTAESSNDVVYEFYSRQFAAGETVLLGSNGQSAYCVNYVVNVQPQGTVPPTEPETEPVTEPETDFPTEPETDAPTAPVTEPEVPTEPATDPVTETPSSDEPYTDICGDVNCDGTVNILDVISLNKSLMVGDPIPAQGRINADANLSGGNPDEVDSLTILKYVVELIPELPFSG
ncbi:MAG: carbohydrate-binding protein, partial [Oscillospiraceae bacterium]|nr:carbohydrate-binding protein [Oscillospiraceae bacterium]